MGKHVVIEIEENENTIPTTPPLQLPAPPAPPLQKHHEERLQKLSIELQQIELVGQYLMSDFELYLEEIKANETLLQVLSNVWNSLCVQSNQYHQLIKQLAAKLSQEWTSKADKIIIKGNAGRRWSNTFTIIFHTVYRVYRQIIFFQATTTTTTTTMTQHVDVNGENTSVKEEIAQILYQILEFSLFVHVRLSSSCIDVVCELPSIEECLRDSIKVKQLDGNTTSLVIDPIQQKYTCTLENIHEENIKVEFPLLCGTNFIVQLPQKVK